MFPLALKFVVKIALAFTLAVSGQISGEIPSPLQVVEDILEAFVRSKKNLFSRVSSKLLYSDKKDDKIEDFVQELDRTGAWMIGRREVLARALLKRVDRCKMFHCEMKFDTSEQLAEHKGKCALRPVTCENEGCGAVFSAFNAKPHDGNCPFKQLPCEQGCKVMVKRGDMDKHCVTLCPMKLVNCPFAQAGCTNSLPQGVAEQHCVDNLGHHLLLVFQTMQKQGVSIGNQGQRINLLEKVSSRSCAHWFCDGPYSNQRKCADCIYFFFRLFVFIILESCFFDLVLVATHRVISHAQV